ncbi:hypothetical protein [Clostridium sp.]|nr:hypothetical protein [Clostridium sp.]MBK5236550.1 hypothetical protein [Clostridium sp.]
MIKKYYGYYNSPIGLSEIVTSDCAIISAMFVNEVKESAGEPQVAY